MAVVPRTRKDEAQRSIGGGVINSCRQIRYRRQGKKQFHASILH